MRGRGDPKHVSVAAPHQSAVRSAEADRIVEHGLEDGLQLVIGAADDGQDLAGGGLLLDRFSQQAGGLRQPLYYPRPPFDRTGQHASFLSGTGTVRARCHKPYPAGASVCLARSSPRRDKTSIGDLLLCADASDCTEVPRLAGISRRRRRLDRGRECRPWPCPARAATLPARRDVSLHQLAVPPAALCQYERPGRTGRGDCSCRRPGVFRASRAGTVSPSRGRPPTA